MDQFRIFRNSNHFILWNKGKFRYSDSLICEFELFPFMGLCFSELLPWPQTFFLLVFTKMKQVRKIPSGVRVPNCGFEIQMKFRFHIVLLASDNCKFNFLKTFQEIQVLLRSCVYLSFPNTVLEAFHCGFAVEFAVDSLAYGSSWNHSNFDNVMMQDMINKSTAIKNKTSIC